MQSSFQHCLPALLWQGLCCPCAKLSCPKWLSLWGPCELVTPTWMPPGLTQPMALSAPAPSSALAFWFVATHYQTQGPGGCGVLARKVTARADWIYSASFPLQAEVPALSFSAELPPGMTSEGLALGGSTGLVPVTLAGSYLLLGDLGLRALNDQPPPQNGDDGW